MLHHRRISSPLVGKLTNAVRYRTYLNFVFCYRIRSNANFNPNPLLQKKKRKIKLKLTDFNFRQNISEEQLKRLPFKNSTTLPLSHISQVILENIGSVATKPEQNVENRSCCQKSGKSQSFLPRAHVVDYIE